METYIFAKNINNTGETGIINPTTNELICLCTEDQSELLLRALKISSDPPVIKTVLSERELVAAWYANLSIDEAQVLAEKYKIPKDEYAPWQMGHYEDRLRVYLGEREEGK